MRQYLVFLLLCVALYCPAQVYNSAYTVGAINGLNNFETLTRQELKLDSLMPVGDTLFQMGAFRQNRARIFMEINTNGKVANTDSIYTKGMPALCECYTNADTLTIKTGVGFFGGFGLEVKVAKKYFWTTFYNYTDDAKPYKYSLTDTAQYSVIAVSSKYQSMQLLSNLSFKPDIPITGYLTFTTEPYFEETNFKEFNTEFIKGRAYFTCKPRAKTEWDK